MGGDFNVTRWVHERLVIGRNTRGMRIFNFFIDSANTMEISLQNGKYHGLERVEHPQGPCWKDFLLITNGKKSLRTPDCPVKLAYSSVTFLYYWRLEKFYGSLLIQVLQWLADG